MSVYGDSLVFMGEVVAEYSRYCTSSLPDIDRFDFIFIHLNKSYICQSYFQKLIELKKKNSKIFVGLIETLISNFTSTK